MDAWASQELVSHAPLSLNHSERPTTSMLLFGLTLRLGIRSCRQTTQLVLRTVNTSLPSTPVAPSFKPLGPQPSPRPGVRGTHTPAHRVHPSTLLIPYVRSLSTQRCRNNRRSMTCVRVPPQLVSSFSPAV